jgi:hypothetical protein
MKFFNYSVLLATVLVLFSCSKKSDSDSNDPYSVPYANETSSESKTNLETAGQDFVKEMNSMKSSQAMSVTSNLATCLSSASLGSLGSAKSILAPFQALSNVANQKGDISDVYTTMSKAASTDPTTIQEAFDQVKGAYKWNASAEEWEKTGASSNLELVFPSTANGTSNDASLVVTLATTNISDKVLEVTNVPTSVTATLSANGTNYVVYQYTASYNSEGVPTSLSTSLQVGEFKIGGDFKYSTSNSSVKYYFTHSSTTLIEAYAEVNGTLSTDSISNGQPQNIVNDGNAYIQVMNVKLVGEIDLKNLVKAEEVIYNRTDIADSTAAQLDAEAWNKYASLVLIYADSKTKIADTEFYSVATTEYGYTDYENSIRLVFGDGTKSDFETYFSNGFEKLKSDLSAFAASVEAK